MLSLFNGFATLFSVAVDVNMYPMFIKVYIYFFN